MTKEGAALRRQRLEILGEVSSPSFVPWIQRHSQRLGLTTGNLRCEKGQISFEVEGQEDLVDALEVGCLLGPIDVEVSSIKSTILPLRK